MYLSIVVKKIIKKPSTVTRVEFSALLDHDDNEWAVSVPIDPISQFAFDSRPEFTEIDRRKASCLVSVVFLHRLTLGEHTRQRLSCVRVRESARLKTRELMLSR